MPGQCHEIWCRQRHEQARGSGCFLLWLVSTNVLWRPISKTSGRFCFASITFGDVILQLLVVFMVDCGCCSPNWQELLKRENVVWAKPLTRVGAKVHRGKGSWVGLDSRVRNLQTLRAEKYCTDLWLGRCLYEWWCDMIQFSSWLSFDVWSLIIWLYKTEHHVVLCRQ